MGDVADLLMTPNPNHGFFIRPGTMSHGPFLVWGHPNQFTSTPGSESYTPIIETIGYQHPGAAGARESSW